MTTLEMTQSVIDLVTAIFFAIGIVVISLNHNRGIVRIVRWIFMVETVQMLGDAAAYIFRGHTDTLSLVMTRLGNAVVFCMQLCWLYLGVKLAHEMIGVYEEKLKKSIEHITLGLCLGAFAIVLVSQFTGFMYYFDADNYYHRNTGWYIFTTLCALAILISLVTLIRNRRRIEPRVVAVILLYLILPVVMIGVQVLFYGLNFISISSILVLLLILYSNMVSSRSKGSTEDYRTNRDMVVTILMTFMMVLTMSFSLLHTVSTIRNFVSENEDDDFRNVFLLVENDIERETMKPITVSDALAHNATLIALFSDDTITDPTVISDEVATVLSSLRDGFAYDMVFAADDSTTGFYTYNGYSRTFDRFTTEDDDWYQNFLDTGKVRELNVDLDKDNERTLSVFVNRRMEDAEGNLLGVCGVGLNMQYLCTRISSYEREYGVSIAVVDGNGTIQIDEDITRIGMTIEEAGALTFTTGTGIYKDTALGVKRLTTYMGDIGWYLVIENTAEASVDLTRMILPNVIIFLMGMVIMLVVFVFIWRKDRKTKEEIARDRALAATDSLTGMGNRRAFDDRIFEIVDGKAYEGLTIVVMDINGLKSVNDNYGHEAGDELILKAAQCMREAFGEYGEVCRTGGDEFMTLIYCGQEQMEAIAKHLEELTAPIRVAEKAELAISIGWASVTDPADCSIEELKNMADEEMYRHKAEYYRKTGKDRRR